MSNYVYYIILCLEKSSIQLNVFYNTQFQKLIWFLPRFLPFSYNNI